MGYGRRVVQMIGGGMFAIGLSGCAGLDFDGWLDGAGSGSSEAARLVRMGDFTLSRGDQVTAIALYEQALAMDPDSTAALSRLGELQQQVGAGASAIDTYQAAADRSPNDPATLRRLGNALIAETRPEDALPYLQQALALADSPEVRGSLGVALDLIGQHRMAQENYRAGMASAPENINLANNLALSLALSGDYDAAVALASEVGQSALATPRHRQTLAMVLGLAGRDTEAAEVAARDMNATDVAANLDYYQLLRSIEPSSARAMAITGGIGAPQATTQVGFLVDSADDTGLILVAAVPH
ncbi:MAG: tetratricopeptide repeat protein [Alphaproteobacteria bacterium]